MGGKERFSQNPYIMELLQAGESEKQMATNGHMQQKDKTREGGCEQAEATGGSRQREKALTAGPTCARSGWETEDRTKWQKASAHRTWS